MAVAPVRVKRVALLVTHAGPLAGSPRDAYFSRALVLQQVRPWRYSVTL